MKIYKKTPEERALHRTKNIFKFYSEGSLTGEKFKDHIFIDTTYECTAKDFHAIENTPKFIGVVNVDNILITTKCDEDKKFLYDYLKTQKNIDDFYLWLISSAYILSEELKNYHINVNFPKLSKNPVIIKNS